MVINSTSADAGVLFNGIFNNTTILGERIIIEIIIIAIIALLITRKPSKWGEITLPILAGLDVSGIHISVVLYTIAAIIFVISILGVETISTTLSTGGSRIKDVFTYGGKVGRDKREWKQAIREKQKAEALNAYDKYQAEKQLWKAKKSLGQIGISSKATFKQAVGSGKSYIGLAKEKTQQAIAAENAMANQQITRTLNRDALKRPQRLTTITDAIRHSEKKRGFFSKPVNKTIMIANSNIPKLVIRASGNTNKELKQYIRLQRKKYRGNQ